MKEKEKFLTASITVEASYIVPMILSIIFAIMVASFYFHDVVIARAVLEKNIEKLENAFIHPLEKDDYYYDYKAINERFLYSFSGRSFVRQMQSGVFCRTFLWYCLAGNTISSIFWKN